MINLSKRMLLFFLAFLFIQYSTIFAIPENPEYEMNNFVWSINSALSNRQEEILVPEHFKMYPDKIINAIGSAFANNPYGEIIVKGPNVMLGYYEDEEKTKQTIIDGWFHTGDLGKIDENGYLYITGRCKSVIVTKNGKNIYPEEVEYYLNDNPLISEVLEKIIEKCTRGAWEKRYSGMREIKKELENGKRSLRRKRKPGRCILRRIRKHKELPMPVN